MPSADRSAARVATSESLFHARPRSFVAVANARARAIACVVHAAGKTSVTLRLKAGEIWQREFFDISCARGKNWTKNGTTSVKTQCARGCVLARRIIRTAGCREKSYV